MRTEGPKAVPPNRSPPPENQPRRVAVITGAGSGIGREVALALGRAGFALVLAGRRKVALEETAVFAGRDGGRTRVVVTDVTREASVRRLFGVTVRTFGRVDVLFNNAGISAPPVPLEELTLAEWRAVVDSSLTGAFLCTREAFRIMKSQTPRGGRIINNGSISAHVPRPHSAPYTAAKHGMTGLTRSTSLDGRAFDIACGQIDIGNAATEMTRVMRKGVRQADGRIAAEPRMQVEDVARAVVYMATLPLDANVPFMTVMANRMPYMGRG